jgi:ATP-binding cassette, subfamily B, bacterial PglK
MTKQLSNVLSLFSGKEKFQLSLLFLLMFVTAFFEAIGIGMIFPFLAIVTNPELIETNDILIFLYNTMQFQSKSYFIAFLGLGLFIIFILKNLIFFFSQFTQLTYLIRKRVEMTGNMFNGYMHSGYEHHLNSNPAVLLRNINSVDGVFSGFLQPLFEILSEFFILVGICTVLLFSSWQIMLGALIFLVIPAWIGNRLVSRRLRNIGYIHFDLMALTSKILLEGLHGIKEILVMKKQSYFVDRFIALSKKLGYIRRDMQLIGYTPKLITETFLVGTVTVFVVAIILSKQSIYEFLPTLGLFAVAAQRMIMSLNKTVLGFQKLQFNQSLNNTIIGELSLFKKRAIEDSLMRDQKSSSKDKISSFNEVKLNGVTFSYKTSKEPVLNNVSFEFRKGQSIGIVGASGAGKSTLMDILLGLLLPQKGAFLIDGIDLRKLGTEWASLVGYIPQSIYLRDDTLKNNISFGLAEEIIDKTALEKAINISQLDEVVNGLPMGVDTIIGERGVRLSGGQRQRIAIARALFHDPQIILMDEATSALDNQTEADFMKSIELMQGEKTLVIIAHRLSTVENCDVIYFMENGKIIGVGNYDQLLSENQNFKQMVNG